MKSIGFAIFIGFLICPVQTLRIIKESVNLLGIKSRLAYDKSYEESLRIIPAF